MVIVVDGTRKSKGKPGACLITPAQSRQRLRQPLFGDRAQALDAVPSKSIRTNQIPSRIIANDLTTN